MSPIQESPLSEGDTTIMQVFRPSITPGGSEL